LAWLGLAVFIIRGRQRKESSEEWSDKWVYGQRKERSEEWSDMWLYGQRLESSEELE